jgi:hypothetical protein
MYSRTPIHRLTAGLVGIGALALIVPSFAFGLRPADDSGDVGTLVGVSGVTTLVSPGTQMRPDNRSGPLGANPIVASVKFSASDDAFMRAVSRHNGYTIHAVRPNDRAGALGANPITALRQLHRHLEFAR